MKLSEYEKLTNKLNRKMREVRRKHRAWTKACDQHNALAEKRNNLPPHQRPRILGGTL